MNESEEPIYLPPFQLTKNDKQQTVQEIILYIFESFEKYKLKYLLSLQVKDVLLTDVYKTFPLYLYFVTTVVSK